MENKLVYLFEFDSVRTSVAQMNEALSALYDEIVVFGNTVVFSFNQIADSALFCELLDRARREEDNQTFDNLVKLFQNGALKISQYGRTRTIVQYLIDILDSDNQFVFSAWPIKKSQPHLCALIKRSLVTCDLSELSYYINNSTDDELSGLFYDSEDAAEFKSAHNSKYTTKLCAIENMRKKIEMIYWLVRFALRISIIPNIYLPPKTDDNHSFNYFDIMQFVVQSKFDSSLGVIEKFESYRKEKKTRSAFEIDIDRLADQGCDDLTICKIRVATDLCYNYTTEYSIFGASLHYPVKTNEEDGSGGRIGLNSAFLVDFVNRFEKEMKNANMDILSKSRNNTVCEFDSSSSCGRKLPGGKGLVVPNLDDMVKAAQLSQKMHSADFQGKEQVDVGLYEDGIDECRKQHRKNLIKGFASRVLLLVFCLFIAVCLDFATDNVEEIVSSNIPFTDLLTTMLKTLVFLLVSEYVTVLLSNRLPCFVSLSEAIAEVLIVGKNVFMTLKKARSYKNPAALDSGTGLCLRGQRCVTANLWFPTLSKSLLACKESWEGKFVERDLASYEERWNKRLGLVYQSEYRKFYVDPIGGKRISGFFERVVNTNEGGIVAIPLYEGNFLFLRQYRHSMGKFDYSLPRGFGEKGVSPKENVIKELGEELGACIAKEPLHIGRCYPDTGLSASSVDVYLVEIEQFAPNKGYEGITDVVSVAPHEMWNLMNENSSDAPFVLTDGFSLAAFALLHSRLETLGIPLQELMRRI